MNNVAVTRIVRPARRAAPLLAAAALLAGCAATGPAEDPAEDAGGADVATTAAVDAPESIDVHGTVLPYRYYPAGGPVGPDCLVVHLDGDGQWGFDHPDSDLVLAGDDGLVAVAHRHGCDLLTVRAPGDSDTWWVDGERDADALAGAIERIRADRGLDPAAPLWLFGFSGGSQQITQFLVPRHPGLWAAGGFVVTGGGGTPAEVMDDEELAAAGPGIAALGRRGVTGHWYTGLDDVAANAEDGYDAISDARVGEAFYRAAGLEVTAEHPAGVDHDLYGGFGAILDAVLAGDG